MSAMKIKDMSLQRLILTSLVVVFLRIPIVLVCMFLIWLGEMAEGFMFWFDDNMPGFER